jgi:hypothetical protein
MEFNSQIHVLAALSPKKKPPGTKWIGWEGLKAPFNVLGRKKDLFHPGQINNLAPLKTEIL